MVTLDYYASVGFALELLALSPYHKSLKTGDYFRTEILPALWANQARFYLTEEGMPTAMVTWAWLDAEVEKGILATGRALYQDEWQSGKRLFINDLIAPYDNSKEVIDDLKSNVFADHIATSIRRNTDGSIRHVNRWVGANVRHEEQEKANKGAIA